MKNAKRINNSAYKSDYKNLEFGEFYGKVLTGKNALYNSSVIISKKVSLYDIHQTCSNSSKRDDEHFEAFDNEKFRLEDYDEKRTMKIIIDMEECDKWRNKYLRNCAVHVVVSKQDAVTGYPTSFTLLFENNFSMTFRSYS